MRSVYVVTVFLAFIFMSGFLVYANKAEASILFAPLITGFLGILVPSPKEH